MFVRRKLYVRGLLVFQMSVRALWFSSCLFGARLAFHLFPAVCSGPFGFPDVCSGLLGFQLSVRALWFSSCLFGACLVFHLFPAVCSGPFGFPDVCSGPLGSPAVCSGLVWCSICLGPLVFQLSVQALWFSSCLFGARLVLHLFPAVCSGPFGFPAVCLGALVFQLSVRGSFSVPFVSSCTF